MARRHAFLVLAAAVAPASALSLSNFQLITSATVPLSCIAAYDQQLPNCELDDFTQHQQNASNTCSAACRSGIALAQTTIKTSCSELTAEEEESASLSSTVLGVALTGDLVGLLCGGTDDSTATSSAAETLITAEPTTAGAAGEAATVESSASASTISTSSIPDENVFFATLDPSISSTTLVQSARSTAKTTTIHVKTGNVLVFPTTTGTAPKATATHSSDGEERGGGSPFDSQVSGGAPRLVPSLAAAAVCIAAMMLR